MSDYDPLEKWEAAARSARAMEFHFAADCLGEAIETVKTLRKPRTITTEAEADALPDGAVIMYANGDGHEVAVVSDLWDRRLMHAELPITVLYVPEES